MDATSSGSLGLLGVVWRTGRVFSNFSFVYRFVVSQLWIFLIGQTVCLVIRGFFLSFGVLDRRFRFHAVVETGSVMFLESFS